MSSRWFRFVFLIAILGAIVAVFHLSAFSGLSKTQASQVKLFAFPTQAVYPKGETISILAVLKNTSTSVLSLSDQIAGTLQIVFLQKDGKSVPTRTSFVSSYESLAYLLKQSLKPLAANESLPLLLTSESDSELGGEALGSIRLGQDGFDQVTFYSVHEPGRYELSLVYEIPVLTGLASETFKGKTNEVTLSFTVTR
jgi:hypothetical protein